jgi:NAD-dependent dihydropyrimidine dehydrogenase PreA subunit
MKMYQGIPRDQIPWFPTIDFAKCVGCQECFKFCKNGVFEWDEAQNQPKIAQPYNCVVGCSACANLCNSGAITFPSTQTLRETIKRLKESMGQEA